MKNKYVKTLLSMTLIMAFTACSASGAANGSSAASTAQAQGATGGAQAQDATGASAADGQAQGTAAGQTQGAAGQISQGTATGAAAGQTQGAAGQTSQGTATGASGDGASAQASGTAGAKETTADAAAGGGTDTLVIYFSRIGVMDSTEGVDVVSGASLLMDGDTLKGNAQIMAEWIAQETGADLFEIQTEKRYSVNYDTCISDAKQEQNENARPALASTLTGLENYEKVYLVIPNWWGDLPMPVYTFFEAYDFAGKQIIVSCTHGGSRFSGMISTIGNLEPEAEVTEGIEIYADRVSGAKEDVISWAKSRE